VVHASGSPGRERGRERKTKDYEPLEVASPWRRKHGSAWMHDDIFALSHSLVLSLSSLSLFLSLFPLMHAHAHAASQLEPVQMHEILVFYCRTTSASTAPCTFGRMCYPTHCASYCAPCPPVQMQEGLRRDVRSTRCRAKMALTRLAVPDYGLGFQVKVIQTFQLLPSCLGSGLGVTPIRICGVMHESKGQHLALTVLHVPCSVVSGVSGS